MRYFVFGDIHGNDDTLEALLRQAGILVGEDERPALIDGEPYEVISIGDLWHVGKDPADQAGDASAAEFLVAGFIDKMIIGNHELPMLFSHIAFNGYLDNPPLSAYFRSLVRDSIAVPALVIGKTLLTHAGLAEVFDWETPEEAFDEIYETFFGYPEIFRATKYKMTGYIMDGPKFTRLPKEPYRATLIDGIGPDRGGSSLHGGIFWHDWSRKRNKRFNQIMGHSPRTDGPEKQEYPKYGTWHLNIDIGAKKNGFPAFGVWLDESGEVVGEVRSPWTISVEVETPYTS